MTAYYNEFDSYAAQWLRNLMDAGAIAPGVVDERSIEDVSPDDLKGFTQCHFFAGIGVWSYALRQAGWSDSQPVWTGSAPCQPFSTAGNADGFDDQRHLWPHFHYLIQKCRPPVVFGEQVASKAAEPWIDLVQDDMEGLEYRFAAIPFPAASVGAPHTRDRLYWVGYAKRDRLQGRLSGGPNPARGLVYGSTRRDGTVDKLAYATGNGQRQWWQGSGTEVQGHSTERSGQHAKPGHVGQLPGGIEGLGTTPGGVGDTHGNGFDTGGEAAEAARQGDSTGSDGSTGTAGPVNGFWRDADWLLCRDGRFRPIEPGTSPLVNGPASCVGKGSADWRTPAGEEGRGHVAHQLKGYGNAIVAPQAVEFIRVAMTYRP